MKLLFTFLTTVLLSQFSFATGAPGPDPYAAHESTNQSGSTAPSAVIAGGQPKICKTCEAKPTARMSNQVGVLNTVLTDSSGNAVKDSSGQSVHTGEK